MRTVTFGVANSLDNFIARADGAVDWLQWTEEVAAFTSRFWKAIDTVVMGRKTYEVAARSGTPAYPGVKNYVCSRTLEQSPHPAVELVSEDAVAFVAALKRGKGKGICMMGSSGLTRVGQSDGTNPGSRESCQLDVNRACGSSSIQESLEARDAPAVRCQAAIRSGRR